MIVIVEVVVEVVVEEAAGYSVEREVLLSMSSTSSLLNLSLRDTRTGKLRTCVPRVNQVIHCTSAVTSSKSADR